MICAVLADTGPLVAFLDRSDQYHAWAAKCMDGFWGPLLTCDAVLAESAFVLQRGNISPKPLLELVCRGILQVDFDSNHDAAPVATLMERYRELPMSFSDACLARMSETHSKAAVWTLDRHFGVYRRNRRNVIPRISPER